jgi:phenylpropionate dioxygenase-like ring-hydroxylating dioxygenase large terminal subunit
MVEPAQFDREQARLRTVWSFLGFTSELPRDGDWIKRDLWGCSVFIQRTGSGLKCFENRCAHRFFPVRAKARGNGPIRCGFHGWQYDEDGHAVGIPMCKELFGTTPRALDRRLRPIEIATCGQLIFGRLRDGAAAVDLATYLGEMAPILETMTAEAVAPRWLDCVVAANWKLAYYITLEDYHIVCIHPSTFGAHGPLKDVRYYRSDPHSAMMTDGDIDEGTLQAMVAACAAGRYRADGYKVFHIFPNLAVLHYRFFDRWYVLVMQYLPLAVDRTIVRTWYFPADFAARRGLGRRVVDGLIESPRGIALRYGIGKIVGEDNAVCEVLQRGAGQVTGLPLLGVQEERIAWFDEAYARAMASEGQGGDAEIAVAFSGRARQEA